MKRVTLITGASSGFGAALAGHYAQGGSSVALLARRAERIEELATEVRAAGASVLPIACDVTDREAVHAAIERCERELGPITLLIANAGVLTRMSARNFDAEALRSDFEVNVFGAAYCVEAVLPTMLAAGSGQIVGISSLAAYNGIPRMGAYSASKAALSTLMESLRIELAPKGIAVTTIHPGFVRTDMTGGEAADQLPFLMELDDAIDHITRAIDRRVSEYAFPWQTATLSRLGRFLPNGISDRIMRGMRTS